MESTYIQHVVKSNNMLNSKEKAYLKKFAQQHEIIKFQIGKNTLDKNVLDTLNKAIIKHELIKILFLKEALQNEEMEGLILDISSGLHCEIVQIIGNTALLFKSNPKLKNRIVL